MGIVQKPEFDMYFINNTMGGVDTLSRVLIPYSSQRRGIKWYRKIAELFVDICVYNSYILWKKVNPDESQVDHLRFRKQLINDLITFQLWSKKKPVKKILLKTHCV